MIIIRTSYGYLLKSKYSVCSLLYGLVKPVRGSICPALKGTC